jgi:hypothetical protein
MNQRSRSKMLASFAGVASLYFLVAGCTTTTTPSGTASSPAESSSASGGSATASSPAASAGGGTASDPVAMGMDGSDRQDADPLALIQSDAFKKELNITAEQSAKLLEVQNELKSKVSKKNASLGDLKGLDAKAKEDKLKTAAKELETETKSSREKIGQILKPEQTKRMKEIFLQIYGWGPLTRNDFQAELKLTPEQTKLMDTINDQMAASMRTSWETPSDPTKLESILSANRKKMDAIMKSSNAKALELLTADQKKTLETLKGKKFEFTKPRAEK